jgi:hypothetical protein
MGGSHGRSWSSMPCHGELAGGEGEGGEGRGGRGGHAWGGHGWGAPGGRARPAALFVRAAWSLFRAEEGKKREKEKKKEKGKKKRRKKRLGKFLKSENFRREKEKSIYGIGLKIIIYFLKNKDICLNINR